MSEPSTVIVASCNLNLLAMDFEHNLRVVKRAILLAKEKGATIFCSSELCLSGYSCEDHFLEMDTFTHCIESLADLLESGVTNGILCAIGCPIMHNNVRYNCVVMCVNSKIVLIRPKMTMADDGNYRERRFFTAYKKFTTETFRLPPKLHKVTGDVHVPFGFGMLQLDNDVTVGIELCEELWAPENTSTRQFMQGCDFILNCSASHTQLRKLAKRIDLIKSATVKIGGAYVYSNQIGCDGTRLFFDGSAMICLNGELIQQGSFFSLNTVEVITAKINVNDVRTFRQGSASLQEQTANVTTSVPTILVNFSTCPVLEQSDQPILDPVIPDPREEIMVGPACYLWDYLRRSFTGGFLLPLSGGADSAATASIIFVMCKLVIYAAAAAGNKDVIADLTRILKTCGVEIETGLHVLSTMDVPDHVVAYKTALVATGLNYCGVTPEILCSHVMHTVYLGTNFSSSLTKRRAENLGQQIGSFHLELNIQPAVEVVTTIFVKFMETLVGRKAHIGPRFVVEGGTMTEDLAMQNIQARIRMVLAYMCAQLLPWVRGDDRKPLLVLGSANVDESLRGYLTKYDCSSADINPIGSMSKSDLRKSLLWLSETAQLPILKEIVDAPPTAELRPIATDAGDGYSQKDEDEMGFTYDELGELGTWRKATRCGPVSTFIKASSTWKHMTSKEVATKVKNFYRFYAINRHKMTTMTPSYHAESYSPDDNRFDLRPFLTNVNWPRQFKTIDDLADQMMTKMKK
jgi:NAD+ synthase (glutamine-hydrolysing)